jgi:hypothetical protein
VQFASDAAPEGLVLTALPLMTWRRLRPSPRSRARPPIPRSQHPRRCRGAGPVTPENVVIEGRRRPGLQKELPERIEQMNTVRVRAAAARAFYGKEGEDYPTASSAPVLNVSVPDRWRITSSLCPKGGDRSIFTLYPNLRGGLRPADQPLQGPTGSRATCRSPLTSGPGFLKGSDWFFIVNAISDT